MQTDLTVTEAALPLNKIQSWQLASSPLIAKRPAAISNADTFTQSQSWVNTANKQLKALEDIRKEFTAKLDAMKKKAMEQERSTASELTEAIAAVKALQSSYIAEQERKQAEAEAEAAKARAAIATAEKEVRANVGIAVTRIAAWSTVEDAKEKIKVLNSWHPKPTAQADAKSFAAAWATAKADLINYAQKRIAELELGVATPAPEPEISVSTAAQQLVASVVPMAEPLKNTRKVYTATVSSIAVDLVALVQGVIANGKDPLPELQKLADKLAPNTPVAGIIWASEIKVINK